ncbi:MAG: extracellular solute-binding protein [Limnobacter sp.]|nr:extracellular solute-binding protein [Limnobacter sp.]
MNHILKTLAVATTVAASVSVAHADKNVINLYSARHYSTDEALYTNFTKQTGIEIKRLEMKDQALLERLSSEGKRSPADVVLLVDAARLSKAQEDGLFQPAKSDTLEKRIPERFQGEDGLWYGFSTRNRVIVYNKENIDPAQVQNYEDLAKPAMKGKVCTRSGSHPYMLSLMSAFIAHNGEEAAQEWANGMVANMARSPKGGDTDQIRAVASGECGVALSNSYYWVRLMRSDKPEDQEVVSKVGFIWPNQETYGTHANISGGAVAANAPNREGAVKFLEYLATVEAQQYFANGNNEFPVVPSVELNNPELESLGTFKEDTTPIKVLADNTAKSQKIMDRAGYK